MADYKLTSDTNVLRTTDGAWIADAPGNSDWDAYQDWLAVPNTPDPADPVSTEDPVAQAEDDPYLLAWIDYEAGQRGIARAAIVAELRALLP